MPGENLLFFQMMQDRVKVDLCKNFPGDGVGMEDKRIKPAPVTDGRLIHVIAFTGKYVKN
jgi:hypothetical protein